MVSGNAAGLSLVSLLSVFKTWQGSSGEPKEVLVNRIDLETIGASFQKSRRVSTSIFQVVLGWVMESVQRGKGEFPILVQPLDDFPIEGRGPVKPILALSLGFVRL